MTDGILLLELRSPLFFGRNIWCRRCLYRALTQWKTRGLEPRTEIRALYRFWLDETGPFCQEPGFCRTLHEKTCFWKKTATNSWVLEALGVHFLWNMIWGWLLKSLGDDGNECETDIACCRKGGLWCLVHTIIIDAMSDGNIWNKMGWTVELAVDNSILGCKWLVHYPWAVIQHHKTYQQLYMCFDNIVLLHMPKNFEQDANIAKGMKRPSH